MSRYNSCWLFLFLDLKFLSSNFSSSEISNSVFLLFFFVVSDVQNATVSFVMLSFSCNKFDIGTNPMPMAQRRSRFANGLFVCIQFGSRAICTVRSGMEILIK